MSSQRDYMRHLWRNHAGDQDRVVREYARAERAGQVIRHSDKSSITPEAYARALLKDGLAKGWLEPVAKPDIRVDAHPAPLRNVETTSRSDILPQLDSQLTDKQIWTQEWFRRSNLPPESPAYLERILAWRMAWRPKRVRVLLVAESHVAEQPGDLAVHVSIKMNSPMPEGYCRLVYCLGYGENELCRPYAPAENGGTWQFWDLFGAVAAGLDTSINPNMPRKGISSLRERLQWKISVLCQLYQAGVWLEDASVVGIYNRGKRLVDGREYDELLRYSFKHFVWSEIQADQPEQVWVIGRKVGAALLGMPMIREDRIISQPQDRDADRYRSDLARLVSGVTGRS